MALDSLLRANDKMSHPVSRTTGPITVSFSGFELCSLPWILLPTSLASGPEISIELNVRGCFVIQLSTFFTELRSALLLLNCKSFCILSHHLLFVKNFFLFCSIKTFKRNCSCFHSKALLSEATHLYYHTAILLSRTFFDFFNCFFKRNNSSLQLVYITMRYSLCQANFSNILSFLFCNKKAVNTSISSCFLPESISCYRNKISQQKKKRLPETMICFRSDRESKR